jgi:phosphodiesterase/alkaline phosphatase D-like protein
MNRLLVKLAMLAAVGVLLSSPTHAQILPPAKRAGHVVITQGPELEISRGDLTIIRWTSNNPGGSDDHYGIVHYGTDPKHLTQLAKSHIRLNQNHPETVFRVRMDGLKPNTTYYYTVDSMEADGSSDGVKSTINHFNTGPLRLTGY